MTSLMNNALDTALIEGIGDPFYAVDSAWRYTSVNQAAVELMGLPRDELLGRTIWELLPQAQHRALQDAFHRVMTHREPHRCEVFLPGSSVWEDVSAFPLGDGIGVIFRDITAQKRAQTRQQALAELGSALTRAYTEAEVLDATLTVGFAAFGAAAGHVYRMTSDGEHLTLARHLGYDEATLQPWQRIPLSTRTPLTDTARDGRARFLNQQRFAALYPTLALHWQPGPHSIATLPLQSASQTFGVIGLSFEHVERFSSDEQRFLQTLADLCASALERSRLAAAEQEQLQRQRFLAQASELLTSTLEPDEVLRRVAQLAVPHLADWCNVYLPGEAGTLKPIVVAHIDPDRTEELQAHLQHWPIQMNAPIGAGKAFSTHEPDLTAWIDYDALRAYGSSAQIDFIERSGMRSVIDVPLLARGRALGVLEFIKMGQDRLYTSEDVSFALDLGKRAGMALDNATLYQDVILSERRFRSLVEASSHIVWRTSVSGELIEEQRQWEAFTGQTRAQYQAERWLDAVHPDDQQRVHETWKESVETHRPYHVEYRLRRADGQYRVVLARAVLVRDEHGAPLEWVGVHQDITERHEAQQALRDREERHRALVEHAVVGFVRITPEGQILDVNAAAAALLGRPADELSTLNVIDVTHPDDQADTARALHSMLTGERDSVTLTKRYLQPDGAVVWSSSSVSAVRNDASEVQYLVAVLVDITERQRMEHDLRSWQQQLERQVRERTHALEQANQELEAFAYSVSHDLRAPVRHISGFLALARKALGNAPNGKADRYLSVAEDAAVRMDTLIDAMLTLSRTSMQPLSLGPVDLDELVERVRKDLEPAVADRTVRWDVAPLPLVLADRQMLHQVMMNLLSNAVKYTQQRQTAVIQVWAEEGPEAWVISVRDNGAGFDPRYQKRLFGVFQRLHRADEFEGIGVGLANVRRIVQRHGGQIWAEGKPDEGALFAFTLRRFPQESPESSQRE